MRKVRTVSRRSFLACVAAGTGILVAGQSEVAQARPRPRRQMAIDRDPRDPAREIGQPPRQQRQEQQEQQQRPPARYGPNPTGANPAGGGGGRFILCPGNRRCPGRNR